MLIDSPLALAGARWFGFASMRDASVVVQHFVPIHETVCGRLRTGTPASRTEHVQRWNNDVFNKRSAGGDPQRGGEGG